MTRTRGFTSASLVVGSVAGAALWWSRRRHKKYDLRDKVVLVTGGSRGLGLVLAREFLRRGARVAICARNEERLDQLRQQYLSDTDRFFACECDLRDKQHATRMVEKIELEFGPIDVVVNNAGTIQVGAIENQRIEDFEEAMRSNFWSAVHTIFAVLPAMRKRGAGRIVNVTSIGAKIAVPHLLPYTASKFALLGFSKGLRSELAKDGIAVTTIVPGLMRTGSPRNADFKGRHEQEYGWFMLSDSLPVISMDAQRAAGKIVDACVAGRGEVVLGLPALAAVFLDSLAPQFLEAALSLANEWVLPSAGDGDEATKGSESESPLTQNRLTALTRQAELENNQI